MVSSSYDEKNIFARIISGEIAAKKIYEDDKILAIYDINPVAPIHILVLPKEQYIDYTDFIQRADSTMIQYYFSKIEEIIQSLGIANSGYRLITNSGTDAGQTIFHFHTHIIAGRHINNLV